MAAAPIFIGTPKNSVASVSTANTNRDGTGTLVTLHTAGTLGARVDRIGITATGTTTAGMVRLFLSDGSVNRLVVEVAVTAVTPSASTAAFSSEIVFGSGLIMQTGYILKASTHNAETFHVVITNGGDY
jgi:hypothetical protein